MKVAIIGGSGKMGRWFARFLLEEGKQVILIGRSEEKLLKVKQELGVEIATDVEAVKDVDVVMLSVPFDGFEPVVKQVAPHTNPNQVILDITSIKVKPVEIMHKYIAQGLVLGTHPVFGPGAKSLMNQNFVLTPTNEQEKVLAEKIRQHLEERGASATLMTPQEHDDMMAVILGLSHFVALVSADTLVNFDRLSEMKAISGTTYRVLLTLVESVLSEDPELYASLQMSIPNVAGIEELFQKSAKNWADLVKSKDRQEFVRRMTALRNKLEKDDPDFGKAYEDMYKLLDRS